jgi:hypothetical protein
MGAWVDREMGSASTMPTGIKFPVSPADDQHLRGASALWHYEVWAVVVDLGRLRGFIMDESSWHLGYPVQAVERMASSQRPNAYA